MDSPSVDPKRNVKTSFLGRGEMAKVRNLYLHKERKNVRERIYEEEIKYFVFSILNLSKI